MEQKRRLWLVGFVCLLGAAVSLSLLQGQVNINMVELLAGKLTAQQQGVFWYIRLPRTIVGLLAGSALGISGAVLQGIFANPLADPGIIGVSGGAALGAVLSIVTGISLQHFLMTPLAAFLGALGAVFFTIVLAWHKGRISPVSLLLAGVAVSIFFGALTSRLLTFAPDKTMHQYLFWMVGGLDYRSWEHIYLAGPFIIIGLIALCFLGRHLNVLSLGDLEAQALGMQVSRFRIIFLCLVAFVTAAAVCVSGNIGFVGLIIPHIIRMFMGVDNRLVLPFSALAGGTFLVFCDTLGRMLFAPVEIRVGIMTAILGAPYFLYLLRKIGNNSFGE